MSSLKILMTGLVNSYWPRPGQRQSWICASKFPMVPFWQRPLPLSVGTPSALLTRT
jgi:hypothetical protein